METQPKLKILFLADSHLGFDLAVHPQKVRRRRGEDFFGNFERILQYALDNQADLILHGGDLFYRTLVPNSIVDRVYENIGTIAEAGIPFVIVPGNHESSRLPQSLFLGHPNIYYFSQASVFNFEFHGLKLDLAGFPCLRKNVREQFPSVVRTLDMQLRKDADYKLLCMHQAIEGAVVGPSNYRFGNSADVIALAQLPNQYHLILSGHIHRHQVLWTKNEGTPILYPGSIERTSFAEKEEEKGFCWIELGGEEKLSHQFFNLPSRPMVDLVLEKAFYSQESIQAEIKAATDVLDENSILRIKVTFAENRKFLKAQFLDNLLPKTMNYSIAGDFKKGEFKKNPKLD